MSTNRLTQTLARRNRNRHVGRVASLRALALSGVLALGISGAQVIQPNTAQASALRTFTPVLGHDPFGSLDRAAQLPTTDIYSINSPPTSLVRVEGWAIDPDTTASLAVVATVDNQQNPSLSLASAVANVSRPDVGQAYPFYGAAHGYAIDVRLAVGTHTICVTAGNLGLGVNKRLGCVSVTVFNGIIGSLDSVANAEVTWGSHAAWVSFDVSGWSISSAQSSAAYVLVTWDGRLASASSGAANARSDIAAAYPYFGANHGYAVHAAFPAVDNDVTTSHQICVYGASASGAMQTLIGCQNVTPRQSFAA